MGRKLQQITQKKCKDCKELFYTQWVDKVFCSAQCRNKANNNKQQNKKVCCPFCNQTFTIKEAETTNGD